MVFIHAGYELLQVQTEDKDTRTLELKLWVLPLTECLRLEPLGIWRMVQITSSFLSMVSGLGNVIWITTFLWILLLNLASHVVDWCCNWHSPGDWSYAEEELKMRLGKSFLIYGNYFFFYLWFHAIWFCFNHIFFFK